ncbi:MAG: hypothetical protein GX558_04495 [Clostridiales bacterium]|nr:hypothetical protein [Clostridiales bacterium]
MDFNSRLEQLAAKYRQFHADDTPGQMLVTICPYTFEAPYPPELAPRPLRSWDFRRDARAFALHGKRRHDYWMDYTKDLDNDYFPALSVNMGYGVHSAYFAPQQVIMGDDTSWTHPYVDEWDKLDRLKMDEDNEWYRRILEIARYFVDWQDGDYAVSGFSNAGPGDMANALRGNDLFYDIYDEPEMVHKLMERCTDAIIWMERSIQRLTGDAMGGSVTANCFFPGRAPYLSGDFSDLCGPDIFREFDARHMQRILDEFGGAFIHHHAKGRHIHGDLAKLRNLRLLEISWDPNMPRPVDDLPAIYEMNGKTPLMVRCTARDVYRYIDDFKRGRTVVMLNIDTLDEGREVMRFIRKHSIL